MLTDIILGPGLANAHRQLNAQQARDYQGEIDQIIYDILRDCQACLTPSSVSYDQAYAKIEATLKDKYEPDLDIEDDSFPSEEHRQSYIEYRIDDAKRQLDIAVLMRLAPLTRFYIGLKDKAIESDFQMVIDFDATGPTLHYALVNQAGLIAEAKTDYWFKGLNFVLGRYWDHMAKAANHDIGINAVEQFDRVRREMHINGAFYFGMDLKEGGIIIGHELERPLLALMAHALPDPRNPFPRIVTNGYTRVRGYTV